MPSTVIAKSWIKKLTVGLYLGALVVIGAILFLPDQLSFFQNFAPKNEQLYADPQRVLTIGYAAFPKSFDPVQFDPLTRSYVADIYESLVQTDRNLKIVPGLAVSWGLVDPTHWEFRLRPGVLFHNGVALKPVDVKSSLDRARTATESQFKDLLNSITSVDVIGDDRVRISTKDPDPLLLTKLAVVSVVPAGYTDFQNPVGTGTYRVSSIDNQVLSLQLFDKYWGSRPFYSSVQLIAIPDKDERVRALEQTKLDILAHVPPSIACSVQDCTFENADQYEIHAVPSLEVTFMIFNFNNEILSNVSVRKALRLAFDDTVFGDILYGFARPAGQFVSNGVFGFNPDIEATKFDPVFAKNTLDKLFASYFSTPLLHLDYAQSLQPLAEIVQSQMSDVGIQVVLQPRSDLELFNLILSGESELYLLGWKSELGDAFDFLKSVAHSKNSTLGYGQFNGANYKNEEVDALIEKSEHELDGKKRLDSLQKVMSIITEKDVIGIPFYESQTLMASKKSIHFVPRVDGYIHPSEIK